MTTIKAESKFYIETSKGKVEIYFEEELIVDHRPIILIRGRWCKIPRCREDVAIKIDQRGYDIFEKLYTYSSIGVESNENGLFLTIVLDDGRCGSPEYKLYPA